MRATVMHNAHDVRIENVADAAIIRAHRRADPSDACLHLWQRLVAL